MFEDIIKDNSVYLCGWAIRGWKCRDFVAAQCPGNAICLHNLKDRCTINSKDSFSLLTNERKEKL